MTVTLGATYFLANPSYEDTDGKGSHIFKTRFTYTKFHLKNQAYITSTPSTHVAYTALLSILCQNKLIVKILLPNSVFTS